MRDACEASRITHHAHASRRFATQTFKNHAIAKQDARATVAFHVRDAEVVRIVLEEKYAKQFPA